MTDVTTSCQNCEGTGTVTETREPYIDELSDKQVRFLVEADLQELKISNPFIGDDDESSSQSRSQTPSTPNMNNRSTASNGVTSGTTTGNTRTTKRPQQQTEDGYVPPGPLPPDAEL